MKEVGDRCKNVVGLVGVVFGKIEMSIIDRSRYLYVPHCMVVNLRFCS